MKKPSLKRQVKLCVSFIWIGAVIALLSQTFGQWLLWAGIGIATAAALCRYTLIRCPHCGHKLVDGNTIPAHCPNCGEELN